MNLSEKTMLRVIACTLAAGLAVPTSVPSGIQSGVPEIYAEEAVKAPNKTDALLQKPLEKTRCTVNSGTEFKMNGRTYTQGIIMGDKTYEKTASISFDISGIKTVSFIPGSLDNTYNGTAKFDIYLDDVLYDTFTLNRSDSIQDERVINNEDGAAKLKIVKTGADSQYALADVTFDGVKSEHSAVTAPVYKTAAAFVGSAYNGIRVTPFSAGGESSYFKMHGRQYFQGVVLGDGTYEKGSEVMFNVENVKTLAFSMGHVDNSNSESTEISVYLDDVLAEKFSLTQNEGVSEYKLDVSKAKTVRFVKSGAYSKYAIADISVDEMAPSKTYAVPEYKAAAALLGSIYNNYRTSVYDGSSQANFFGLNGRKYYQGIILGDGSYEDGAAFSLNVETLKTLEFTVGHVDGSTRNSTEITVYVDNVPTEKVDIATGYPLANVKLDVSKAKTVRIVRTGDYSKYAIADIKADELTSKFTYTVPEYKDTETFIDSGYDKYRVSYFKGESKAQKFNMAGRTYYQGVVLGDGTYEDDAALTYNVENVKEISFDLGHVDDTNTRETELKILLDNETVKTIPLTYNMPVTTQKIDVSGAKTIRFYKPGAYSEYALANITVDGLETKTPCVVPVYKNGAEFAASAYDTVKTEKYTDENKFKTFTMDGIKYTQGITLGSFNYEKGGRAVFNVEYVDTLAFTVGSVSDVVSRDDVLEVYADGNKIDTISLSATMKATEYSYNLSGVSRLMFSKPGDYATYGLADFKINETAAASPAPTVSPVPTAVIPTTGPTNIAPTAIPIPTVDPTIDPQPTELVPTTLPTTGPTNIAPTAIPIPTVDPTIDPQPTELVPTALPTTGPTNIAPTAIPIPTVDPSIDPVPTELVPTATPKPTATATAVTPTATVKPTASPVPSPSAKPLVDLSGDGKTTTSDVRVIMKAIVGKIKLTAEQEKGADVDGNGKLDSVDAVLYLKRVVADAANED